MLGLQRRRHARRQRNLSLVPTDVPGLTSGVAAIAAGSLQDCALTSAGGVKCRGHNSRGQLGDGTTTDRSTPVDVTGLSSGVRAIAAGSESQLRAHERRRRQVLGRTPTASSATARRQPLDAGRRHRPEQRRARRLPRAPLTAARLRAPAASKCWGCNDYGELGNGTTFSTSVPVDVSGLNSGVTAITAGAIPQLRAAAGRRRQVLGLRRVRPARRRHDHLSPEAREHRRLRCAEGRPCGRVAVGQRDADTRRGAHAPLRPGGSMQRKLVSLAHRQTSSAAARSRCPRARLAGST